MRDKVGNSGKRMSRHLLWSEEISLISNRRNWYQKSTNRRIPRIQFELLEYMFDVEYRKGKARCQMMPQELLKYQHCKKLKILFRIPLCSFTKKDLEKAIKDDKKYLQLLNHVKFNSPCPKEFKKVEEFLGLDGEYVTMGERKVIPLKLREKCLELIYITHDGENSMLIMLERTYSDQE
uniref:FERM domain-containing protein n=1 Tax=Strongyloides venezuelensis TaxID=75913 RepID=A0A0K0FSU2_STRVS